MIQNLAHKKGVKQDRTKIRDAALESSARYWRGRTTGIDKEPAEDSPRHHHCRFSGGLSLWGGGSQMTTIGGLRRKIAHRMSFGPSMSV